jgi:glucoamylase
LRRADDRRIQNTLQVSEALLRVDTPAGVAYHRYHEDGYGEHEDGSPFDGSGIGRAWPLLTGERGHYELQAGRDPLPYLEMMARMTGPGGLIPEQIWDAPPIPDRGLVPGEPTGAAMPLVWAHAEFLKLLVARREGQPIELLRSVQHRYRHPPRAGTAWHWRHGLPFEGLPADRDLVIEATAAFKLHLGFDGWSKVRDEASAPLPFGRHGVRLRSTDLTGRDTLDFAFYFIQDNRWEGVDHHVRLGQRCP